MPTIVKKRDTFKISEKLPAIQTLLEKYKTSADDRQKYDALLELFRTARSGIKIKSFLRYLFHPFAIIYYEIDKALSVSYYISVHDFAKLHKKCLIMCPKYQLDRLAEGLNVNKQVWVEQEAIKYGIEYISNTLLKIKETLRKFVKASTPESRAVQASKIWCIIRDLESPDIIKSGREHAIAREFYRDNFLATLEASCWVLMGTDSMDLILTGQPSQKDFTAVKYFNKKELSRIVQIKVNEHNNFLKIEPAVKKSDEMDAIVPANKLVESIERLDGTLRSLNIKTGQSSDESIEAPKNQNLGEYIPWEKITPEMAKDKSTGELKKFVKQKVEEEIVSLKYPTDFNRYSGDKLEAIIKEKMITLGKTYKTSTDTLFRKARPGIKGPPLFLIKEGKSDKQILILKTASDDLLGFLKKETTGPDPNSSNSGRTQ